MKKRTSWVMAIAPLAVLTLIAACSGQPVGDTAGAPPAAAASSPAPVVPPLIPREAIIGDDVPTVAAAVRGGADANAVHNDGSSATPLQLAAEKNAAGVARLLLENKVDVNQLDRYGGTALMRAAQSNSAKVVPVLLEYKADVDISEKSGYTALMFAAEADACDIVRLLVEQGTTVSGARNAYGFTPLLHAVKGGSLCSVEALVGRGADVNDAIESTDENAGTTALMYAAGKKSLPIVEFLVARGADVNARAKNGQSALDVAMKAELNDEVIAFLKARGDR
jgi:ankyrin repeat protein